MAPLRNAIAGGAGGAMGAAGLVGIIGGFVLGGPVGWIVGLAGVAGIVGGLHGAAGALTEKTVSEAFQNGLLSGLRVGSEVLRVTKVHYPASPRVERPQANSARTVTFSCYGSCSLNVSSDRASSWSSSGIGRQVEELINDRGQRVGRETLRGHELTTYDVDLSEQSSFRVATGVAARCDACGKILSIGNGWYHALASEEDLCARHLLELPHSKRSMFCQVNSEQALGDNQNKYSLKVRVPADVFPRAGPHVEGKVVLEISHLINNKGGTETLASLVRPLMPLAIIEECEGPRSFCRIIVEMKDEAAVREVIKSLGKQRKKRVNIQEISREFDSPRF